MPKVSVSVAVGSAVESRVTMIGIAMTALEPFWS